MLSNSSNVYYNSLKLLDALSKPCSLQSKIVIRRGNCVISAMIFLWTLIKCIYRSPLSNIFVLHFKNSCLLQTINLKLHATNYHMQLLFMVFFATTFDSWHIYNYVATWCSFILPKWWILLLLSFIEHFTSH